MSEIPGKKKALGRGLSALLDNSEGENTPNLSSDYSAGSVTMIPVSLIEPNPFQPRSHFNEEELAELAISISEQGIIQPLTLRKLGPDKFQIIAGERRLRASKAAGISEVPAYIRLANDEQMLEMALVENIQRSELNPLEIAISYQRLLEECHIKQEELSQKVGKNRSTIANYIRLLKLPPPIQMALRDNLITMGHARAIINLEDEKSQLIILQKILEQKLSVRQVEDLARNILNPPQTPSKTEPVPLTTRHQDARTRLSDRLQHPVGIKLNGNGKGTIVIKFKSDEELDKILSKLDE